MLTPVLRGFDEYSWTEGISSLMRLTLNAPASVMSSPSTTDTGIGTSCTASSRRRAPVTEMTSSTFGCGVLPAG